MTAKTDAAGMSNKELAKKIAWVSADLRGNGLSDRAHFTDEAARRLQGEGDAVERPMTGFFAQLTLEQQARALAYTGDDHHGDPSFPKSPRPAAEVAQPDARKAAFIEAANALEETVDPHDESKYGLEEAVRFLRRLSQQRPEQE